MPQTLRIQLAVQGGGAKIAALLAALTAIEELRSERAIEITRVAGTSAGSIAGAMFAAGIPMADVRRKLLAEGPKLIREFRFKGWLHAIQRVVRGKSLWLQKSMSKLLQELLKNSGRGSGIALGQMRPPMFVTATDLRQQRLQTWEGDKPAVAALLDSSAIPFAFRVHKDEWSVDGGICENLPSSLLMPGVHEFGPVLAISFQTEFVDATRSNSLFEYCKSLLLAAMNNSVKRAKDQLGASCIELKSRLTTFDFNTALEFLAIPEAGELPDSEFRMLVRSTKESVLTWIKEVRAARSEASRMTDSAWQAEDAADPIAVRYRETQRLMAQVYREQHSHQPVLYRKLQLLVVARSLEPENPGQRDDFMMESVIDVKDAPCYCHKISLIQSEHESTINSTEIKVFDGQRNLLDNVVQIPIDDEKDPLIREVLIFFIPPLRPENGPYTVRYKSEAEDILKPLRTNGVDDLYVFATRPNEGIEEASVVLILPKAFGTVELNSALGAPMSEVELTPFDGMVPVGYQALGYRAKKLPPETRFEVGMRTT